MDKKFTIPKLWKGRSFVLGGGASLKAFPFEKLKNKKVVGCNDSYKLGAEIVDFCCFGDSNWWNRFHCDDVARDYKSLMITNEIKPLRKRWNLRRCDRKFILVTDEPGELSWFRNTGYLAIHVSIKLGATEIILLGFDMKLNSDGKANWYENRKTDPDSKVYPGFITKGIDFDRQIRNVYPNVKIINANPDSELETFEKRDWKEFV